jgi:hypothetical protein
MTERLTMPTNIIEAMRKVSATFPSPEPVPPSAFAKGVAEELRELAAQIDTGDLVITHFSLTVHEDTRQKLEIDVA